MSMSPLIRTTHLTQLDNLWPARSSFDQLVDFYCACFSKVDDSSPRTLDQFGVHFSGVKGLTEEEGSGGVVADAAVHMMSASMTCCLRLSRPKY